MFAAVGAAIPGSVVSDREASPSRARASSSSTRTGASGRPASIESRSDGPGHHRESRQVLPGPDPHGTPVLAAQVPREQHVLVRQQRRAIRGVAQRLPPQPVQRGGAAAHHQAHAQPHALALRGRDRRLERGPDPVPEQARAQRQAVLLLVVDGVELARVDVGQQRSGDVQLGLGVGPGQREAELHGPGDGVAPVEADLEVGVLVRCAVRTRDDSHAQPLRLRETSDTSGCSQRALGPRTGQRSINGL